MGGRAGMRLGFGSLLLLLCAVLFRVTFRLSFFRVQKGLYDAPWEDGENMIIIRKTNGGRGAKPIDISPLSDQGAHANAVHDSKFVSRGCGMTD